MSSALNCIKTLMKQNNWTRYELKWPYTYKIIQLRKNAFCEWYTAKPVWEICKVQLRASEMVFLFSHYIYSIFLTFNVFIKLEYKIMRKSKCRKVIKVGGVKWLRGMWEKNTKTEYDFSRNHERKLFRIRLRLNFQKLSVYYRNNLS